MKNKEHVCGQTSALKWVNLYKNQCKQSSTLVELLKGSVALEFFRNIRYTLYTDGRKWLSPAVQGTSSPVTAWLPDDVDTLRNVHSRAAFWHVLLMARSAGGSAPAVWQCNRYRMLWCSNPSGLRVTLWLVIPYIIMRSWYYELLCWPRSVLLDSVLTVTYRNHLNNRETTV